MKLILIRHLKPEFDTRAEYTAEAFTQGLKAYYAAPLADFSPRTSLQNQYAFYCSRALSSFQTVLALFGEQAVEKTGLLDEIPLVPPQALSESPQNTSAPSANAANPRAETTNAFAQTTGAEALREFSAWRKIAFRAWNKTPSLKRETIARAEALIETLETKDQDAVLVSHEFFIRLLLQVFKGKKYEITRPHLFSIGFGDRIRIEANVVRCGGCRHNCHLSKPGCELGRDKALLRRIPLETNEVNKRF